MSDPDRGSLCARLAATLVIVAACASVAQVLSGVLAGRASAPAPIPVLPTALKVVTGLLWVVAGLRFRAALAPLNAGARPAPPSLTERTGAETRMLEDVFLHDPWLIDKADAHKELRESRHDLEARRCRI